MTTSESQEPDAEGPQPPSQDGLEEDIERRGRVRIPRKATRLAPDFEIGETLHGSKPGSLRVRRTPRSQRLFSQTSEGDLRAEAAALKPRSGAERAFRGFKRVVVGAPLASEEIDEQRISKSKALAVFSSDALSSSAYATDEILLVLVAAGTGALTHSVEIALAIGALLAIVTFSYRQTIRAYPNGGGAYIVARENLGDLPGVSAAAALSVDYILTVSVSTAAGVFAITSAFPDLHEYSVPMAVAFVLMVTLANLRGIRESSTIFAIPTYAFIGAFSLLLVGGFIRLALNPNLTAPVPDSALAGGTAALTPFLLLRAFSSGSAALTGVEAISNGIPAFRKPESRNAAITLMWMAIILGTFFIGLTILAHELDIRHAEEISVPAQAAKTIFGGNIIFYGIQAATALILILAANTCYADFPRLASILARDRFAPRQFAFRGDRLAFSNGIFVLGLTASVLLVIFQADVNKLIPLYAFGVFVSFTLSQGGMVVHWWRLKEAGWQRSMVINGVGAVTTGVVALIVGVTKFEAGAWISMAMMVVLAFFFSRIHQHYSHVEEQLEVPDGEPPPVEPAVDGHRQHAVLVPVDDLNRAVLRTLDYARSLSENVTAIHVTDDVKEADDLRDRWEKVVPGVPMVTIESPYRSLIAPVFAYIDALDKATPGVGVTVVLPEFIPAHFWEGLLHNQSASRLKRALLGRPNTVVIDVPYHLRP